jgi:hypothetical protein
MSGRWQTRDNAAQRLQKKTNLPHTNEWNISRVGGEQVLEGKGDSNGIA